MGNYIDEKRNGYMAKLDMRALLFCLKRGLRFAQHRDIFCACVVNDEIKVQRSEVHVNFVLI